jgi:hypothetical protein
MGLPRERLVVLIRSVAVEHFHAALAGGSRIEGSSATSWHGSTKLSRRFVAGFSDIEIKTKIRAV